MIDWITVKGFKSIRSVERLPLRARNVLVGANGSGKSNFIEVFAFLNALRSGRLQYYTRRAGGADRILHFGTSTTDSISIHVSFDNEETEYMIQLDADAFDSIFPSSESINSRHRAKQGLPLKQALNGYHGEGGNSVPKSHEIPKSVLEEMEGWKIYHFFNAGHFSPLKRTCDLHDNRYLRTDGSNLAAFLFFYVRSTTDHITGSRTQFELLHHFLTISFCDQWH